MSCASAVADIPWPAGPVATLIVCDHIEKDVFRVVFGREWSRDHN